MPHPYAVEDEPFTRDQLDFFEALAAGDAADDDEELEQRRLDREYGEAHSGRYCVCGCGRQHTSPGSYRWFQAHMDCPVWVSRGPGGAIVKQASMTVRELVAGIVEMVSVYGSDRQEVDMVLGLVYAARPSDPTDFDYIPRSYYMIRRLAQAPHWSEFEYHVCASKKCVGHVFVGPDGKTPTDPSVDPKCPHCGSMRMKPICHLGTYLYVMLWLQSAQAHICAPFDRLSRCLLAGATPRMVPVSYMIYFGLENVIRQVFFSNDDFTSELSRHYDLDSGASWLNGGCRCAVRYVLVYVTLPGLRASLHVEPFTLHRCSS